MKQPITVRDNLDIAIGALVVAHLRADQALTLAGELARGAFRRIAAEEGADSLLADEPARAAAN